MSSPAISTRRRAASSVACAPRRANPDGRILRLRDVVGEHLSSTLGYELPQRIVLSQLADDEREYRSCYGIGEVGSERLRVGLFPFFDTLDHDQPPRGEEAEGIQRGDHILARHRLGSEDFDRFVAESGSQAAEGAADLRAIGSGEEVDRAQLVRHRR
jgi:hypothetical protein